jgi:tetraacyldisaccharide 4'-kinase
MLLAAPIVLLRQSLRKKYLPSARERLGVRKHDINPDDKPSIWIHAVSVGEALAAKSLIAALRREYPDHLILISTTTLTGQDIARKQLQADGYFFFPFDWKFSVRRSLKATNARMCIVMETEIWPNFIKVLNERRIPLILANGRISDRSFRKYTKFRWFFKALLRRFFSMAAQSDLDAQRLVALGAREADTVVTGNLKYGRDQFDVPVEKIEALRDRLEIKGATLLFVAGSTHEGEEEIIFEAFEKVRSEIPNLKLALVPRKPERFDDVAALLEDNNVMFSRYSSGQRPGDAGVVLVDAMGVLAGLYHLAEVAFVGGSLVPRGGHNLLEACAAGTPVLFGPHMHNFRAVSADILNNNAGFQVKDGNDLELRIRQLLRDRNLRDEMAKGAAGVIELNQEALPRTMKLISEAAGWSGISTKPPAMLWILAAFHRVGASIINRNPRKRLAEANRLNTPVISVGGLSFGGAGKTPMVSLLADYFVNSGKKVALLTRGYGGKATDPYVVSDGAGNIGKAYLGGDEAVMLARRHPAMFVVKDADRFRGGVLAEELFKPEVILLEDGFQHRALWRDVNVLMLDADSVVSPRWAGQLLREKFSYAAIADTIILLNSTARRTEVATLILKERFKDIPIHSAVFSTRQLRNFQSGEIITLDAVRKLKVIASCGIATPARFVSTVRELGLTPLNLLSLPDHHIYRPEDLERMQALLLSSGADAIITTEKDEQRLDICRDNIPDNLKFIILRGGLEIEQFNTIIERINSTISP